MFSTHWCLPSVRSRLLFYDWDKIFTKSNLEDEEIYLAFRLQSSTKKTGQKLRQRPQLWHGWGLSLSLWLPLAIILFLSVSPVLPTPHPIQSSQFSSFSTGWRNTCSVLLGLQCLGSWHRIKKKTFHFQCYRPREKILSLCLSREL